MATIAPTLSCNHSWWHTYVFLMRRTLCAQRVCRKTRRLLYTMLPYAHSSWREPFELIMV